MARAINIILLALSFICISATCTSVPTQNLNDPPIAVTGPHVQVGTAFYFEDGTVRPGIHGSGTVISHGSYKTYILTVKHAATLCDIEDEESCNLSVWSAEESYPLKANIERHSRYGLDATIISIPRITNPVAKIAARNAREGTPVFVLGAPRGPFRTVYRHRIFRYRGRFHHQLRHYRRRVDLDGPTLPGFSGGGVYDARSRLVAMTIARLEEDSNRGVCIPVETLHELIRQYQ